MVIAVPRINRDSTLALVFEHITRINSRSVIHAQHDHAAHIWPEHARITTPLRCFFHPDHVAMRAIRKPDGETFPCMGNGIGPCDATDIKAQFARARAQTRQKIAFQKSRFTYSGAGVIPGRRSFRIARKDGRDFTRAYQCFAASSSPHGTSPRKSTLDRCAAAARSA